MYAVPDEQVGDQVMAAIVLGDGADLTPEEFGEFLAGQPDLSPKAWPRHVWLTEGLPTTATNKILKRELTLAGRRTRQAACCGPASGAIELTRSRSVRHRRRRTTRSVPASAGNARLPARV